MIWVEPSYAWFVRFIISRRSNFRIVLGILRGVTPHGRNESARKVRS
jgi:hypothetical protein